MLSVDKTASLARLCGEPQKATKMRTKPNRSAIASAEVLTCRSTGSQRGCGVIASHERTAACGCVQCGCVSCRPAAHTGTRTDSRSPAQRDAQRGYRHQIVSNAQPGNIRVTCRATAWSIAADVHDDATLMRTSTVLPQVNSLPGAERQTPVRHGYDFAGFRQCRSRMRRHVVRPLVVVLPRARFRCKVAEPTFQIAQHGRIGVFLNHEAGRRVLNEDGAESGLDAARRDDLTQSFGNIDEAPAARAYGVGALIRSHGNISAFCILSGLSASRLRFEPISAKKVQDAARLTERSP